MENRVKVKEPPRNGNPSRARYHLKDSSSVNIIGWTDSPNEAFDWLAGFGDWSVTYVFDRKTRTVTRPNTFDIESLNIVF
jgi:hypothetical protein